MSFQVKSFDPKEDKSLKEREEELLKKAEGSEGDQGDGDQGSGGGSSVEEGLKEEDVINFLKSKSGKDFSSIDDLFKTPEPVTRELPEEVEKYLKFKEETGRGFQDFVKAQRDIDKDDPDSILKEYLSQTEKGLDADEIDYMFNEKFGYDEEMDDEDVVKRKQIEKKKELVKAKEYLKSLSEKYKAPLESRENQISKEELESFKEYKAQLEKAKTEREKSETKTKFFEEKSKELLTNDFKGFEYKVGDRNLTFNPSNTLDLIETGKDLSKLTSKFLDENGLVKDVKGNLKSIAAAIDPDRFARHFYELGVSEAIESEAKKMKNISTGTRNVPQYNVVNGLKIKAVSSDGSGRMTIKKS